MDVRGLMKEWRVWVLVVALLGSTVALGPHYEEVDGDVTLATSIDDRKSIEFSGGSRILLGLQSNETGEDLKEQTDQIVRILQLRLSNAGIADTNVRSIDLGGGTHKIQVQTGSSNTTQLKELISQQGSFEARMPIVIPEGTTKNFTIDEEYRFQYGDGTVTARNSTGVIGDYSEGESFTVNENTFYYVNQTNQSARMEVVAYSGEDIIEVLTSQGRLSGSSGSYQWSFQIAIDSSAAERVQKIAKNYETIITRGGSQLGLESGQAARLTYYVDGEESTSLTVAASFKRQVITQPSIQGGAETRSDAVNERNRLQAILQSGRLPVPVQIESVNQISSSLGDEFLYASGLSILAALIGVGGIVYLRYRDPRVVIPIVLTGASEIYILLGFWFTSFGTLSLSAIAGIIAAVGTGVDDQIIITDESGREKIASWSDRMKKAFFVIFTSAASTIGAMSPVVQPGLMSLMVGMAGAGLIGYSLYSRDASIHYVGIGVFALMVGVVTSTLEPSASALQSIHEFAWTTIWGIMIGILITRPAYAKTIEYIKAD